MKALVTGANGFIGSHLCELLKRSGHSVRAMVRVTSDLRWIADLDLELAYADLLDPPALWVAVQGCDWVFHLGATVRTKDTADFERINAGGTRALAEACVRAGARRFVLFSSAAAAGPAQSADQPATEQQECQPVSAYGQGKLMAERAVLGLCETLHSVVLRLPTVYGPRDRDGVQMWRTIKKGLLPAFGGTFSVVYVADAVRAALLAAERDVPAGSVYLVSDGCCHDYDEVAVLAEQLLGRRPLKLKLPAWLVEMAASFSEWLSRDGSIFGRDRVKDLNQQSWVCSPAKARAELGFEPEFDLARGLAVTLGWYRKAGWL